MSSKFVIPELPGLAAAMKIREEQGTKPIRSLDDVALPDDLIDENDGFLEAILQARDDDAKLRVQ